MFRYSFRFFELKNFFTESFMWCHDFSDHVLFSWVCHRTLFVNWSESLTENQTDAIGTLRDEHSRFKPNEWTSPWMNLLCEVHKVTRLNVWTVYPIVFCFWAMFNFSISWLIRIWPRNSTQKLYSDWALFPMLPPSFKPLSSWRYADYFCRV